MRVSRRRYSRRFCRGGVTKFCSTRTKGHFSVRENVPVYEPVQRETVWVSIPSVLPRRKAGPLDAVRRPELNYSAGVVWMNPQPGFVLYGGQVCASKGVEKSCVKRTRRKRGLRKGRRRARGCQPRRSVPRAANVPTTPSSRNVNHIGRKYIWARKTSNIFSNQCEKLNRFPRGELPLSHPARGPRLKMKRYLLSKWTRLHDRAEAMGIPPVAAFHASFWKYLLVETSRVTPSGRAESWDALLYGLPGNPNSDFTEKPDSNTVRSPPSNRRRRGVVVLRPGQNNRVCRACGYVGPGPHEFGVCRRTGDQLRNQRGRPLRRR